MDIKESITAGNAISDGKEFHFWLVGRIDQWCKDNNIPFDEEKFGLRNNNDIELKWGAYKKGDVRENWAACSDMIGMSILLKGNSTFYFRDKDRHNNHHEVRLASEGDYVIWREQVEHSWKMDEDSVFITLRWRSGGSD